MTKYVILASLKEIPFQMFSTLICQMADKLTGVLMARWVGWERFSFVKQKCPSQFSFPEKCKGNVRRWSFYYQIPTTTCDFHGHLCWIVETGIFLMTMAFIFHEVYFV